MCWGHDRRDWVKMQCIQLSITREHCGNLCKYDFMVGIYMVPRLNIKNPTIKTTGRGMSPFQEDWASKLCNNFL